MPDGATKSKPIVFFSHSVKDKRVLQKLKEFILTRTSDVDIFLSSDGQSIPFGSKWEHKIEEALKKAKIAFVFVSPNSLHSKWVYFEAGYMSRDLTNCPVVPVSILGLDHAAIPSPLSILQSFSINSGSTLGNILSEINKRCKTNARTDCTDADYSGIFAPSHIPNNSILGEFTDVVDYLKFELKLEESGDPAIIKATAEKAAELVKLYLQSQKIPLTYLGPTQSPALVLSGMNIDMGQGRVTMRIDPSLSKICLPLAGGIAEVLSGTGNIEKHRFTIFLRDNVEYECEMFRLTARCFGTNFSVSEDGTLEFRRICFQFRPEAVAGSPSDQKLIRRMEVTYSNSRLGDIPLFELFQALFDFNIVRYKK